MFIFKYILILNDQRIPNQSTVTVAITDVTQNYRFVDTDQNQSPILGRIFIILHSIIYTQHK